MKGTMRDIMLRNIRRMLRECKDGPYAVFARAADPAGMPDHVLVALYQDLRTYTARKKAASE
jgi:hypothetical protein